MQAENVWQHLVVDKLYQLTLFIIRNIDRNTDIQTLTGKGTKL